MKILFISHYFPPEVNAPANRTHEHARRWVADGHDVTVITCVPNHPRGEIFPGHRNRLVQEERVDGIRVIRPWTYVTPNEGFLKRMLNYLLFAAAAVVASAKAERPDVVVATSPQFFVGIAGAVIATLRRRPFVLEVRDLWPDSIVQLGQLEDRRLIGILEWIETRLYRRAAGIVVNTRAFIDHIAARGVSRERIELIYNGIDAELFAPRPRDAALLRRHGLDGRWLVAYVGTLGLAHGLVTVLDAAERLRDRKDVTFLFIGDGADRARLEAETRRRNLDNVRFLGLLPRAELPAWIASIDCLLVMLRDLPVFATVIPSKIFEFCAQERPVIVAARGEIRRLVEDARAGFVIDPENAEQLAAAIEQMRANPSEAAVRARAGREWVEKDFQRDALARSMAVFLERIAGGGAVIDAYEHLPVVAQNLACSFAGWQRERARFTPYFHRILRDWEHNLEAPVSTLHAIQRERLDRLVRRAREHTRFWRDLPPPSDAGDPETAIARTLASIPPLDKATYRDRAEEFIAGDIPRERLRRGKTSGTTGTALPLWYTSETLAEEYATVWRLRRASGVAIGEPHLTFGGQIVVPLRQQRPPYWRMNWWGRQALFSLYHMKPENLPAYVAAIHASPASFVQGYPSSLHLVARAMLEAERPLAKGRLKAVFTSSESLLAFQRDAIETAFGAPVRDRYGTSEFAVSMTGCAEGRLHVDMEFGIVEVEVEEETEEWVRGPLLVTGLGNDATPLLRYRIGDVGTRSKRPCPCGRRGDVFLDIDGRLEDYVVTPDGRWIGRLDHIFKDQLGVAEAQILQERQGAIEVRIVPRTVWDAATERSLRKEIRARLGDTIEIEMRVVDTIPREANGKFRAVKSALGRPSALEGVTVSPPHPNGPR